MRSIVLFLALVSLSLAACSDSGSNPATATPSGGSSTEPAGDTATPTPEDSTPADTPTTPPPAFEGTTATTTSGSQTGPLALLTDVRVGRHDEGFDRIVFEFAEEQLPAYQISLEVPPPVQCGSGESVTIAGAAVLLVNLRPAAAHNDAGEATIGSQALEPGYPAILEAVQICDFEGQVEWAAGLANRRGYRVMELEDPARLVVDILH